MRRVVGSTAAGLIAVAVVEVVVLVLVARWLGVPGTVLLVAATSVLGAVLLRREGIRAWRRFRQALDAAEPPGVRVADGLIGLVGALLLAVPGLVTDLVGLLLLVPPVRSSAGRWVRRAAEGRMSSPLAGDVFGPRRVRVRQGRPRTDAGPTAPTGPAPAGSGGPGAGTGPDTGPVLEGEIVDPGDRR